MLRKQEDFLKDAVAELIRHKVGINLVNSSRVVYASSDSEECKCNGYFDEEEMMLACAIGKPQKLWFPIFLHEFCHFTQWRDNAACWDLMTRLEANDKVEEWISSNKFFSQGTIRAAIKAVRSMELDCECRAVKIMKERELGIDYVRYIKLSNAYLFFYTMVLRNRKWYVIPPYEVDEIMAIMPGYFVSDYDKLPPKFGSLVEKHCYK